MSRVEKHLFFGWWYLAFWVTIGLVLEGLHGFKVGWYLDVGNDTRRLMFTLAHAHGSFLALLNIVLALTARARTEFTIRPSVSIAIIWAALLLPGGFLLGGIVTYGGDPGLGVWLVPVGALLLLYSVVRTAVEISKLENSADETVLPIAVKETPVAATKKRRR